MAEIVTLNARSSTEDMRQRFEAFVRRGCRAGAPWRLMIRVKLE